MAKNSKLPAKRSAASTAAAASKKGTHKKVAAEAVPVNRRDSSDRRGSESGDRRKSSEPVPVERRIVLNRREKVSRRRQIDPTTCERDYTTAEVEFMAALDEYKRRNGRMFPTCSEILEVFRSLGYEKRPVAAVQPNIEQPVVCDLHSGSESLNYTAATL